MKNKAYYFSHDGNAHNDVKIQYLINDLGMEGYGIFWFLIEKLFEAGGVLPLKIIKILSAQMNVSEAKVSTIINNYDLFVLNDETFYSQRLMRHFEAKKILSDSGKKGAQIKWGGYSHPIGLPINPPNSLPNGGAIDTPIARKEKKRKEKKIKEIEDIENIKGGMGGNEEFSFWNKMPLPEDAGDLPETKIKIVIEKIKHSMQVDINQERVLGLWEVFKNENLTGKKYYGSEEEVQKHFYNWIKFQKIEKNGKSTKPTNGKNAGAKVLLTETERNWEYLEDEKKGQNTALPSSFDPFFEDDEFGI